MVVALALKPDVADNDNEGMLVQLWRHRVEIKIPLISIHKLLRFCERVCLLLRQWNGSHGWHLFNAGDADVKFIGNFLPLLALNSLQHGLDMIARKKD